MRKIVLGSALSGFVMLSIVSPAFAQEGCKMVTGSCTQLSQSCEKQCQTSNNASACVGRFCAPKLETCKSTGVWRSANTGAACWKTNNRT